MESSKLAKRRRYSEELKAQVLAECELPGASVAKVAMSHGINANIVHGWRKLVRDGKAGPALAQREFVPVRLGEQTPHSNAGGHIEVELHRGTLTMKLAWPLAAAQDLGVWIRELLR